MEIIEQFLDHYIREIDFYEQASRICAQICETELDNSGIRAIVTYRVKRIDRLKDKLIKRNRKKQYKSIEEIYADVVDLAGVRIALYFPSDKEQVDKFIKSEFVVKDTRHFPVRFTHREKETEKKDGEGSIKYQKLFSGYHATHYRVNIKESQSNHSKFKYSQANIEIQVASVLMHAWSEVEHDLVYKPLNGGLSIDEYEILDELNGLILAGELALKRLQKAVKERVTEGEGAFSNHYELASFIYSKIASINPCYNMDDIVMGRADLMFKFIQNAGLNSPEAVEQYIRMTDPQKQDTTVVEQMINKMLDGDAKLYKAFIKSKSEVNRNPYSNSDEENGGDHKKAVSYFVDKWADLQYVMSKYLEKLYPEMENENFFATFDRVQSIFEEDFGGIFDNIKDINSELVHNSGELQEQSLIETGKKIENIISKILERFDPEERPEIMKKINEIEIKID